MTLIWCNRLGGRGGGVEGDKRCSQHAQSYLRVDYVQINLNELTTGRICLSFFSLFSLSQTMRFGEMDGEATMRYGTCTDSGCFDMF